jgi:hypothetical protein
VSSAASRPHPPTDQIVSKLTANFAGANLCQTRDASLGVL